MVLRGLVTLEGGEGVSPLLVLPLPTTFLCPSRLNSLSSVGWGLLCIDLRRAPWAIHVVYLPSKAVRSTREVEHRMPKASRMVVFRLAPKVSILPDARPRVLVNLGHVDEAGEWKISIHLHGGHCLKG